MVRLLSSLKERKHNKTQELTIKKGLNHQITGSESQEAEIDVLSCYYKVVNTVNTDGNL